MGKLRVLAIDDDKSTRELLRAHLETDYVVDLRSDGVEGLQAIRSVRPDIVLSDVEMPRMDGFALARILKSKPDLARIPLLLVTAREGDFAAAECLDAGADDYVRKPIQRREFLARVGAAARHVALSAELEASYRALHVARNELLLTFDQAADAIVSYEASGIVRTHNAAATQLLMGGDAPSGEDSARLVGHTVEELLATPAWWQDGEPYHVSLDFGGGTRHLEFRVAADADSGQHVAVIRDVTWAIDTRRELERQQERLAQSVRLAGQARVATGVLHNVANVLNSARVGAEILRQQCEGMRPDRLRKLAHLLEDIEPELRATLPDKAPVVVTFAQRIASEFATTTQRMQTELKSLQRRLQHAAIVLGRQQRFAKCSNGVQELSLDEVVATALDLADVGDPSVVRRDIQCESVIADEHRILEILINLLSNAADAVRETETPAILVRTVEHPPPVARVDVTIADNGIGLAPERLGSLFEHGVTTKVDGHGFGLHSCAQAASEMGGTLSVSSEGIGRGASFTLSLPRFPVTKEQNA